MKIKDLHKFVQIRSFLYARFYTKFPLFFYKRKHLTEMRKKCFHWLTYLFTLKERMSRIFCWQHCDLMISKIIGKFPESYFGFVLKCTLWLSPVVCIHSPFVCQTLFISWLHTFQTSARLHYHDANRYKFGDT